MTLREQVHRALISGFVTGVLFCLAVLQMIINAPGPVIFEHCETILEVRNEQQR